MIDAVMECVCGRREWMDDDELGPIPPSCAAFVRNRHMYDDCLKCSHRQKCHDKPADDANVNWRDLPASAKVNRMDSWRTLSPKERERFLDALHELRRAWQNAADQRLAANEAAIAALEEAARASPDPSPE